MDVDLEMALFEADRAPELPVRPWTGPSRGPGPRTSGAQRRRRRRPGLDALPDGERGGGPPLRPRGPAPGQPRPALPVPRRGGGSGGGGAGGGPGLPGSLPGGEPPSSPCATPRRPGACLNELERTEDADGKTRALQALQAPQALLASLGAGAARCWVRWWPRSVALAHPLGNFTVNRYARVESRRRRTDGVAPCACATSWTSPRSPPSRPCPRSTSTATGRSARRRGTLRPAHGGSVAPGPGPDRRRRARPPAHRRQRGQLLPGPGRAADGARRGLAGGPGRERPPGAGRRGRTGRRWSCAT